MSIEKPVEVPRLETGRLMLRQLQPSDAEDMFEYAKTSEVTKYVSWASHDSLAETRKAISKLRENAKSKNAPIWAITDKDTNKMIGTCGIGPSKIDADRGSIGYVLSPDYWGRGLVAEACRAVMEYGFRELGFHTIAAGCGAENLQSKRVMEKLRMSFEKRDQCAIKDKRVPILIYSISRKSFEQGL